MLGLLSLSWLAVSGGGGPPGGGGDRRAERRELAALEDALEERGAGSQDYFVSQARQAAVRRLAELGTPRAWELVLGALEDPSPRVADEAQLALGGVGFPEALAELLGRAGARHRDAWVRRRASEAVGRVALDVEAEALARALGDGDAEVRRALLWSVERLARRGLVVGDLDRLERRCLELLEQRRDAPVAASALRALGALAPDAVDERLAEALEHRDAAVRGAAVEVAARRTPPGPGAAWVRAAADPARAVRRLAAEALERHATRPALLALVDLLEQEPRPRAREALRDALRRLTGMRYRLDPRPWRQYAESLPEDWRGGGHPLPREEAGDTRSAPDRLPIRSDRVAVLVDFSGSIWKEGEDGRTRKELVDEELRVALTALPESTRFNLIPYADEPEPWSEELVAAEPAAVRRALDWFADCRVSGRGNVFDAVLRALEDAETDTLLILTDGAPTGGHRWNLGLMADLLIERNRIHAVAFDVVLVDAPSGSLREAWDRLCRATGGELTVVDW